MNLFFFCVKFHQGFLMTHEVPESGSALAMRALRRATVYAFAGVGLLSLGIWKAMGVHNVSEFFLSYRLGLPVSVLLFSPIHNNDNTAVDTNANKIAFRISQHALGRGVPGAGGAWSGGGCLVPGGMPGPGVPGQEGVPGSGGVPDLGVPGVGECLVWGVPGPGGAWTRGVCSWGVCSQEGYGIPVWQTRVKT